MGEEIGSASKMARGSGPFKNTRTREEVNMQWVRAAVSAGLPIRFFDNKEVRKSVLFTAECGSNYIGTKPGGVKEPTLNHRTYFTTKLIPTLDKLIDDQNMGKMRAMAQELAAAVFSDGWTAVDHHPMHVWIRTFLKPWSDLMWLALKFVLLPYSASACEHSWSIEGWINSKRRNRLGQQLVERLVHTHTSSSIVWSSMRPVSSHGTLRWWLKSLCQTTRTGSPTVTVTLTLTLTPTLTLTKFLRILT